MNGWMDQWVRLHWCCVWILPVSSLHHHLHHCSKKHQQQQQQHHCSESQHLSDIRSASSQLKHGTDRGFTGEPADIHKFPRDASFIFVPGRPHCRVHPTFDIHGWVHWTQLSVFNMRLAFSQNKPKLSSSHTPELPDHV